MKDDKMMKEKTNITSATKKRRQYQPLSTEDIKKVHETSMHVLSEVGFEVQEPTAFELFKKVASKVDHERHIVYLDEKTVKNIIATVPPQLTLCGREEKHDRILGAGDVCFGTGGTALNVLDYEPGKKCEQRPANLQDLIDIIRLVDRLDHIDLMLLPTYPNDLPFEDVDINRFFAGLQCTTKHIMGGVYTAEGIDAVIRMAEKVAGSPSALRERPFISMITCGISPLRVDSKYGAYLIDLARRGIPTAVPVEPLCGATAPITLAGTLVIQNCDGLITVMLSQLAQPGAPVIYGSVATSVNLHDIRYLGGPVESGMINAGTAQMAGYYGFPYYSTAGISDSKTLDTQCGYETAVNNLLVALAGGDFIHDAAGLMEFATTVSKEKLVIDNEILGMVRRAVNGIEVNENTLAFSAIQNAGPGGNFVAQRHTRRYMNKEHYFPSLSNRDKREDWVKAGSKTTGQEAYEIVAGMLNEPPHYYLDEKLTSSLWETFPNIKADHYQVSR